MAYPVSTGGSDQWQTSDGNKHDSMGEAKIAQDNIDSGKNMSFTNQQSSSGPKSLLDDPAYAEKNRKDWENISKLGDAVIDGQTQKMLGIIDKYAGEVPKLRDQGEACYNRGDWDGAIAVYTKILSIYTGPKWEQFKKEMHDNDLDEIAYHDKVFFENKDFTNEMKNLTENYFQKLQKHATNYKHWLALSHYERSKKNEQAKNYDEAINDGLAAIQVYPYKDEQRENLIGLLVFNFAKRAESHYGKYYNGGAYYFEREIADYSVALNLAMNLPSKEQIASIKKELASNYRMRGEYFVDENSHSGKISEEDYKQAYLAWTAAINLEPDNASRTATSYKERRDKILKDFPHFAKLQPQEDPAVQEVLNIISGKGVLPTAPQQTASSSSTLSAEELVAQGRTAYSNKDYAKAVELYRMAAEKGDKDAQNYLAFCYHDGKGVAEDEAKAIEWWKKSASMGNETARRYLTKNGIKW